MARWILTASLITMIGAQTAQGGLYLPAEVIPWPLPTNLKAYYRVQLQPLQSIPSTEKQVLERELPKRILQEISELEQKRATGLSVEQATRLGSNYLLRGDPTRALRVLTEAQVAGRQDFRLLGALALAYFQSGEYRRAVDYQARVLAVWPREQTGWTPERLRWYRRVEMKLLELMQLRQREALIGRPVESVDELFPGFRFVGSSGQYAAGELDLNQQARLPLDTSGLIGQLLLWMPHDNRLLWWFAEWLNARGEVALASELIARELVDVRRFTNKELMDHRRVLRDALDNDPRFRPEPTSPGTPALAPSPEEGGAPADSLASDKWLPSWRELVVGFVFGLLVGILGLLQLRQLTRRRSAALPARK